MRILLATLSATMLFAALPVHANILATGSVSGGQGGTNSNDAWMPLQLNGKYYSVTFTTSAANTMVRVIYTASCAVYGSGGYGSLGIRILIDGVITTAWSSGNQSCTAGPSGSSVTSTIQQGTLKVAHSGSHKVTADAYPTYTTYWGLNFSSTVVDQ